MNRSRPFLKDKFQTGDTPTEENFSDLIDSFVNKAEDGVQLDANGNLTIPAGLNLTNAVNGTDGTLRFNAGNVEVFSGGTWHPIAGASGAFVPVGAGPDVAFAGGNVGIGNFLVAPTHKLEIPLTNNTGPNQRVRMGNLVVHNGTDNQAYISHQNTTANLSFAVRQDATSNTTINAGPNGANNAVLTLSQQAVPRLQLLGNGDISLTPTANVGINGNTEIGSLITPRNLTVWGTASKPGGGGFLPTSDARVKKDVKTLAFGLDEICQLNPVRFKFNGKGGTPNDGKEYVGLIAQEVAKIVPSMVMNSEMPNPDQEVKDVLTYDPTPLTFMLINAVRELADRVVELESKIASKVKAKH